MEGIIQSSFETLADYQRLSIEPLNQSQIIFFLRNKNFFICPKNQEMISRKHSSLIDRMLGYKIKENERDMVKKAQALLPQGDYTNLGPTIHCGIQTWVGLDPSTLQTPYNELFNLLKKLKIKNELIIDLGAAYGRMGIIVETQFKEARFTGFEAAKERVKMGQDVYEHLQFKRARLWEQDIFLDSFSLPKADVFFIYDYGFKDHILKTLNQCEQVAQEKNIRIVARGILTQGLIKKHHPWLEIIDQGSGQEKYIIYQSRNNYVC